MNKKMNENIKNDKRRGLGLTHGIQKEINKDEKKRTRKENKR